jgi:hypothetical protein
MPIDKLQAALASLYEAREQIKQTIYEICGIGDILRGVTDPNETKGAQVLKSQWGSLRLQRLQREVQRMVRDVLRLKSEVIAERFSQPTLQTITNMKLPTMQEKQMAQQIAAQAQAAMQPLPPEVEQALRQPAWEEVIAVLRRDTLRNCRIDVETDSTVAETIDRDMAGLAEVTTAIGGVIEGSAAGVQMGMIPVELPKEIALAIARRARLGSSVEDALEKITAPPPPPPPPEEVQKGQQMQQDAQTKEQDIARREAEVGLQQRDTELGQRESVLAQQQDAMARDAEMQKQRDEMMGVDHGRFAQVAQQLATQQQADRQQMTDAFGQVAKMLTQVMQASQQQLAAAVQASEAATQAAEQTIAAVLELKATMEKPKKITFERNGPNDRISGATAEVVH